MTAINTPDLLDLLSHLDSPLFLDGWLEFNRRKWNVQPLRVRYTVNGKDIPAIEAVLYLDKKGRIVMPPRNPYLPVRFLPTSTKRKGSLERQWLELSGQMAEDFLQRGFRGHISLSPGVLDMREWQWRGIDVSLRYTYVTLLPYDPKVCDSSVGKNIRKATRSQYTVKCTTDWTNVADCLLASELRKNFSYQIAPSDLAMCLELLGDCHLRAYLGASPNGEPASAHLNICASGAVAIDWMAGTKADHLNSGINQMVYEFKIRDLHNFRASAFDFTGANIRPVAAAKSTWGFSLVPYPVISSESMFKKSLRKSFLYPHLLKARNIMRRLSNGA